MSSEAVYFFRHVLLREAAYQVQLPSHRARLHRIAFAVIESLAGGPAPDLSARDAAYAYTLPPHPSDPFAAELEEHASLCHDSPRHRRYLARAAAHASRSFENDQAWRLWKRFAALVEGAERVAALRNTSAAARNAGRPADSERTLEEALQACGGQEVPEADTRGDLAVLYRETGRNDLAGREFERALALHRHAGNRNGEARTLGDLGTLYLMTGRVKEAEAAHTQCLGAYREAGNRLGIASSLAALGDLYARTGRTELAESAYAEALQLHRESGNRRSEGIVLGNLANFRLYCGRPEEAARFYEQALALHRSTGNRRSAGLVLSNSATLLGDDRLEERKALYEEALALHREVGDRRMEGITLGNLALVHAGAGRREQAEHVFRAALEIHREQKNRQFEGIHTCGLALVRVPFGSAEARAMWREGMALIRNLGDEFAAARVTAAMREACGKAGVEAFVQG